jgi:hypothetical protein
MVTKQWFNPLQAFIQDAVLLTAGWALQDLRFCQQALCFRQPGWCRHTGAGASEAI